jgi:predicted permease
MLKSGVTQQQGADNLNSIAGQLSKAYPTTDDGMRARLVKPGLMGDALGGPARPFLAAIMGLALLVLAAASVNLAGIFAARATDRSRELAIRLSIGSTRGRILRQLLTEALLISFAGGLAGTAFAGALLAALSRWQPVADFPIHVTVVPDGRVYGIAFLLSLASGILPGLLPARQIWRTDTLQALKAGTSAKGKLFGFTLRDVLLGVQITLCAVLVTAALVSLRGMERSLKAPMGFTPQNAVLAEADTGMAGYSDDSAFTVQRRMIAETERIPGVEAVGTITSVPLNPGGSNSDVYREGAVNPRPSESILTAHYYSISPGYLRAADTPLLAGRNFTWDDGPAVPKVAIVNETFARTMFGKEPAVGRRFLGGGGTLYQIVGIVKDGKYETLTEDPSSAMFFPLGQSHDSDSTLVVRSQLPPGELESALRRVIAGIDPSMPVAVGPWEDSLALVRFPARVATATLGVMGLLAALLAVTGIFGMAAYSVSKRLRELGIRVALGAKRSQVVRSALGRPLVVLLAGSVAGLALGIAGSRMLAFLVYEATPRDPLVLAGAVMTMTLLGLIATWIPARRAIAVNPAELLRED